MALRLMGKMPLLRTSSLLDDGAVAVGGPGPAGTEALEVDYLGRDAAGGGGGEVAADEGFQLFRYPISGDTLLISAGKKEKSRPPTRLRLPRRAGVPGPAVNGHPPPPDRIPHQLLTKRPDQ